MRARSRPFPVTGLLLWGFCAPALAGEKGYPPLDVRTQLSLQYITEDNKDLDVSRRGRDSSFSQQAQVSVKAPLGDDVTGFASVRALNIDGDAGFDDDTGRSISRARSFVELRELWLRADNLGGAGPWSLQAGRQRLREMRALWWNSDFDMVRLVYNTTQLKAMTGVGENLSSWRTSSNDNYRREDKDRFRALGEVSWQYRHRHFLEGRVLLENDHSGLEPVGTVIRADDRDNEDQEALWGGIRAAGTFDAPVQGVAALKYRADVLGLTGESGEPTSVAGPGTNFRTITGANRVDLRSWAFDGGVVVGTDLPLRPVFTLGYAHGSGDGNAADGTDRAFRQSGLHGKASRFNVERQQQKSYGEVLRPELSNLHIVTLGAGLPLSDTADVSLTYFNYRLDEKAGRLRGSGISAPLNGVDGDVGDALDLAFNMDLDGQVKPRKGLVKDVDLRVVMGTFFAGDAYEPASDKMVYRLFTELKFRF